MQDHQLHAIIRIHVRTSGGLSRYIDRLVYSIYSIFPVPLAMPSSPGCLLVILLCPKVIGPLFSLQEIQGNFVILPNSSCSDHRLLGRLITFSSQLNETAFSLVYLGVLWSIDFSIPPDAS